MVFKSTANYNIRSKNYYSIKCFLGDRYLVSRSFTNKFSGKLRVFQKANSQQSIIGAIDMFSQTTVTCILHKKGELLTAISVGILLEQ